MTPNALILKIHEYPGQICRRKKKKKHDFFRQYTDDPSLFAEEIFSG